MGFFSDLDAEKYDRTYSDRDLIKRIQKYLKPHSRFLLIIAGLVLFISASGAVQPVLVSRGLDRFTAATDADWLYALSGIILTLGITRWIANWGLQRLSIRIVSDLVLQLATDGFRAATENDLSFFDELSSGKIVSRITTDTRDFGQLIILTIDLISQIVEAIIVGYILIRTEWHLSLLVLMILPVVFILSIAYRGLARRVTRTGMRAMAEVNATIKETISGISVAKNFRQENSIYQAFSGANRQSYQLNFKRGFVMALVFPGLNVIGGLASALLVYFGGRSVVDGIVTAGNWYLFMLSLDVFLYPVLSISSFITQVQTGLAAAERVFALIDADPSVRQIAANKVATIHGDIQFRTVNFAYKQNEEVICDFNLHIQPGETIALVGHTGAGKSSIAKLIARFYEFQSGEILIDGKDIRTFDLTSYRRKLGIVSQAPFLFSGTVAENIRYACPETNDEEILKMANQIGNGEWLETMPDGIHTQVGERGNLLSMGQRQLVSLMRVLMQKPSIFILDEATASIDPFTEWQIQQALNLILECSTSILIAHRLSTVKSANRIIVMQDGGIIEEGNHAQLLEKGGHYADLYNTYFRHQSISYAENVHKLLE
jgi:ATP-binding cassette subfamily B protein